MRNGTYEWMINTYGLDIISDVLLDDDEHIGLIIDLKSRPITLKVIAGDIKALGLPLEDTFEFSDLQQYIEKDNTLSEVQGRKTFIKDFVRRLQTMHQQTTLHMPLKTNGNTFWLQLFFKKIRTENGRPALIFAQVLEVFDHVPDLILFYKKTHQDTLTELFTRETLKKHMDTQKHTTGAYGMYIDLDGFKAINDRWGHLEGDRFLKCIAQTFIDTWESNVLYYRLGGDEFFVYIYHFNEQEALEKARAIIRAIETTGKQEGIPSITASLGMVPVDKGMDYHALLDVSDKAMYLSKERGTGNITLIKGNKTIAYDDGRKTLIN